MSRSRTLVALATALLLSAGVMTAPAAQAGDGRASTPEAELEAQYAHSLDRASDPEGFNHYMKGIKDNCLWGVMGASYSIATSPEARSRWKDNPEDLVGMLYASLLDRGPDQDGFATYTNVIRERSLEWAAASILSSDEYNARLASICNNRSRAASMYSWGDAQTFMDEVLVEHAINLGSVCGFMRGVQFGSDKAARRTVVLYVQKKLTDNIYNKLDGSCKAAATYALAAGKVQATIDEGRGYNPVFIQTDTHRSWWTLRNITYFNLRVGPNPLSWAKYDGKVVGR